MNWQPPPYEHEYDRLLREQREFFRTLFAKQADTYVETIDGEEVTVYVITDAPPRNRGTFGQFWVRKP